MNQSSTKVNKFLYHLKTNIYKTRKIRINKPGIYPIIKGAAAPVDFDLLLQQPLLYFLYLLIFKSVYKFSEYVLYRYI